MQKKEREAIFALLEKHGITEVKLFFDGGHDEGAINDYAFFADNKKLDASKLTARIDKESTPGIIARMEEALYAYYGEFDDHPEVWGTITWHTKTHAIMLKAEEEVTTTKTYTERL